MFDNLRRLPGDTYVLLSCPECVWGPPQQYKTVDQCVALAHTNQDTIELASFSLDDEPMSLVYDENGTCNGMAPTADVIASIGM